MTIPRCCALVALIWMLDASNASAQCSYSVTQTTFSPVSTASVQSTSVITGTQCSWTATSAVDWITITNGSTHTGMGSVSFSVATNPDGSPRTGTLIVAGQTVTVTQQANTCTYTLTPSSFMIDPPSTIRTLSVTSGTQCSWSATTTETWITITNAGSGSGTSAVTFSVTANTGQASRIGKLTVAGQAVTVTQAGVGTGPPPIPSNLRIVR
jgi:all-beta uncharacterized protein